MTLGGWLLRAACVSGLVIACARPEHRVDTTAGATATAIPTVKPDTAPPLSPPTTTLDSAPIRAPATSSTPGEIRRPPTVPADRKPNVSIPPSTQPGDPADTVRGIVTVVGTAMDSRLIIRPQGGGPSVTLVGDQAADLKRITGTDVWAEGPRDSQGRMVVRRFVVRTVDSAPALDGTLRERDGRLVLVTEDGREHVITSPPDALRQQVGSRVWITGSLATGAVTFGVIRPRS